MTGEETLARLAESRRALHQALDGLSEEEMTQVQVEGVWTVKDVLRHIASWEEICLEPLRHYVDGGPFEVKVIEDYLAWNDEQAARKRDIPLDVILRRDTAYVGEGSERVVDICLEGSHSTVLLAAAPSLVMPG